MIDHMFALRISELADGGFELRQQGGSLEEPSRIVLHPVQVRLLAERAGLIQRPAPTLPQIRRDLERIRDAAADLFHLLASVPCFPPQADEDDDVRGARELVERIDDLLDDIEAEQCNGNSAAISVTPTKRGRPKKEDALTPAERQAKHRAKQTELQLPTTEKEQLCPI